MIADKDLDILLRQFAGELAEIATWPDGSAYGRDIDEALFHPVEFGALIQARVYGEVTGTDLRRRLALAEVLTIEPEGPLSDAVAGFFAIWARLLNAFAKPLRADPAAAPHIAIARVAPRKLRDTIFERGGSMSEKTGGADLSPGQPISTEDYRPQVPARFDHPVNLEQMTLDQRAATAGFPRSSLEADAEDTRVKLGGAPLAPAPEKLRVAFPDDGKMKSATVFIQRPDRLAANAPALLRAAPDDTGPVVELGGLVADE